MRWPCYRGDRKAGFHCISEQFLGILIKYKRSIRPQPVLQLPFFTVTRRQSLWVSPLGNQQNVWFTYLESDRIKMVRTPPANGLLKKAAWYAHRRFLVVSAPFLHARQTKPPATQATRSVLRLQFAHPNRLGTSQVTPDTNLIAIQFFTVSSVSSLHPARSRKVWQPGEERNRGIKVL